MNNKIDNRYIELDNDIEIIYNLYNSINFDDISSEQTNVNICINLMLGLPIVQDKTWFFC